MPVIKSSAKKLGKTVIAKSVASAFDISITCITAPKPDCVEKDGAQMLMPPDCPKFIKCHAPICPLDVCWHKPTLLSEDPNCFYMSESVKNGAETVFQEAGLGELYAAIAIVTPSITDKYPRIYKALERAKLSGSRMTRFMKK